MSKQMNLLHYNFTCIPRKSTNLVDVDSNMNFTEPISNFRNHSPWAHECYKLEHEMSLDVNPRQPHISSQDRRHVFMFNSSYGTMFPDVFAPEQLAILPYNQQNWSNIVYELNTLHRYLRNNKTATMNDLKNTIQRYNTAHFEYFANLNAAIDQYPFKNTFFTNILPHIISLALQIEILFPRGLPCLITGGAIHALTISQKQIACLLCNAFLCTFVNHNTDISQTHHFPSFNFKVLFTKSSPVAVQKLKAFINYFDRITQLHSRNLYAQDSAYSGSVTFARVYNENVVDFNFKYLSINERSSRISSYKRIEQFLGCIQVDFANKIIGGGILTLGSVQEEIMMLTRPELIAARIFVSELMDKDALHIIGSECFNVISGYSQSIKWEENYVDHTPRDLYGRMISNICAIDAIRMNSDSSNFQKYITDRELVKAYAGFIPNMYQNNYFNAVATGFWGCGAFKGNKEMKALIQLLACVVAGRQMIFTTYGDEPFAKRFSALIELFKLKSVTVEQIYNLLIHVQPNTSAFDFISNSIRQRL